MAPRKGFSPFSRVTDIEDVLSSERHWYVLTSQMCGMNPTQYFNRSPTVSTYTEEFARVRIGSLRLLDGSQYHHKGSSNGFEVLCSSFGLLTVLLRQKSPLDQSVLSRLKTCVNAIDFSDVQDDNESVEITHHQRPRAARQLSMPIGPIASSATPPKDRTPASSSSQLLTPPPSGNLKTVSSSPTLKDISMSRDLETPEKALLMKQRTDRVLKDVQDACGKHRESLSTVLSNMCAFGDPEAKAIVNEIVEEVAVKRGVKRGVEELVGEETLDRYVESLRVPDWILLYFKTKARVSGRTWQAVINITGLGRTGVRYL